MLLLNLVLSFFLLLGQPFMDSGPQPLGFVPPLATPVAMQTTANLSSWAGAVVRIERGYQLKKGTLDLEIGTGFFLNTHHILTCAHVVGKDKTILVTVYGEKETQYLEGRVLAKDDTLDLALIEVADNPNQTYLSLSPERPPVGAPVVVIGFPFGLWRASQGTVTGWSQRAAITHHQRGEVLSTDGGINDGSAGGPVIDVQKGRVVAMAVSHMDSSDGNGFAIPASQLLEFYEKGLTGSTWLYPFLGIRVALIHPANAQDVCRTMKWDCDPSPQGVVITKVLSISPADRGGLKVGDTLVSWNGAPIETIEDVYSHLQGPPPQTPIHLQILRHQKPMEVTINPHPFVHSWPGFL